MANINQFTCSSCGKIHEEWPALTYPSPSNYHILPEEDKKRIAELDDDFCVIRHPEQTDRFIRVTLIQKVIDHCANLEYGLWVSLSENSFDDYAANFNNEQHEVEYFGWLCNNLPEYTFEQSITTTVCTQPGNIRPVIVPHKSFDHPFVKDYYEGITKAEAEKRIKDMLTIVAMRNASLAKKSWWKFW